MKKMIVKQSGVIETEEQAYDLLERKEEDLPDDGGMAWADFFDRTWAGQKVEALETEIFDLGHFPKIEELTVIRLTEVK